MTARGAEFEFQLAGALPKTNAAKAGRKQPKGGNPRAVGAEKPGPANRPAKAAAVFSFPEGGSASTTLAWPAQPAPGDLRGSLLRVINC